MDDGLGLVGSGELWALEEPEAADESVISSEISEYRWSSSVLDPFLSGALLPSLGRDVLRGWAGLWDPAAFSASSGPCRQGALREAVLESPDTLRWEVSAPS